MPLRAIVTGSSSGIGRSVAQRLAADGFAVLLADVRREPLTGGAATDELIFQAGGRGEFVSRWQSSAMAAFRYWSTTRQSPVSIPNPCCKPRTRTGTG